MKKNLILMVTLFLSISFSLKAQALKTYTTESIKVTIEKDADFSDKNETLLLKVYNPGEQDDTKNAPKYKFFPNNGMIYDYKLLRAERLTVAAITEDTEDQEANEKVIASYNKKVADWQDPASGLQLYLTHLEPIQALLTLAHIVILNAESTDGIADGQYKAYKEEMLSFQDPFIKRCKAEALQVETCGADKTTECFCKKVYYSVTTYIDRNFDKNDKLAQKTRKAFSIETK